MPVEPCYRGEESLDSLTIVIPALNEEQAIAAIIERCLAARAPIRQSTGIRTIDIVVVSDGSTDRTAQLASAYEEIHLVVFPQNRGYGAAIMAGWRERPNALLAFIDADGTCDPLQFIPMCTAVREAGCDIALGSRMGPGSRMPPVRRLGNRCYAWLLRLLSGRDVQDTASGMRVIRRSSLPLLMPLPDGLHFTPAMSARALLDNLKVVEVPVSYKERVGRSKLSVLKDGLTFLNVILATVLFVRPGRAMLPVVSLLGVAVASLMARPAIEYLKHSSVQEWMIYRFLFSSMLVIVAALVAGCAYIMEQVIAVSRQQYEQSTSDRHRWWTRLNERWIAGAAVVLCAAGVVLVAPAIPVYLTTGHVVMHWSRVIVAMLAELLAAIIGVVVLLSAMIRGVVRQQSALLQGTRHSEEMLR
jgi:hypothetical protein